MSLKIWSQSWEYQTSRMLTYLKVIKMVCHKTRQIAQMDTQEKFCYEQTGQIHFTHKWLTSTLLPQGPWRISPLFQWLGTVYKCVDVLTLSLLLFQFWHVASHPGNCLNRKWTRCMMTFSSRKYLFHVHNTTCSITLLTPRLCLSIIFIATLSPVSAWYANFTLAKPPAIKNDKDPFVHENIAHSIEDVLALFN